MKDGPNDDLDIKPQRPVINVIQVVVDALAHLLDILSRPPKTVDLRPTRNTGSDSMPLHVGVNLLPIVLIVFNGVRARSNNRHITKQHIEKLRHFVEAIAAQEGTDPGHSLVPVFGLR